jgi:hypothetical protein
MVLFAAKDLIDARRSLERARAAVTQLENDQSQLLTTEGRAAARQQLVTASKDAADAQATIDHSASLSLLSSVPIVGWQINGASNLASDVKTASTVGVQLIDAVDHVDRSSSGTNVSLASVAMLDQTVQRSAATLASLHGSTFGIWGPTADARTQFNQKIGHITDELDRGHQVLAFLGVFLGSTGPKTYLLAAENEAEMRDQGSVLSLGQIHAVDGKLSVDSPASVGDYPLSSPADYPIPPGTAKVFGGDFPTQIWQSANLTADFPWTGGDLVAMYRQATGVSDDGVVALDVHALAALLSLSGPVSVPGISTPVTAQNVEPLLLNTLYQQYSPDEGARKDELSQVATSTFDQLSQEHVSPSALAHALAQEISGRHLILYDEQPSQEATLRAYGASGAVDDVDPQRSFHLAVESATAAKLDYFIHSSISQRISVTASGDADVATTVTVANDAPAGQSPSYQLGPDDINTHVPGEYAGLVCLWSPRGSQAAGGVPESGLVLTERSIDVLPGQKATISFVTVIPKATLDGVLQLRWIPQSSFNPLALAISVRGPKGVVTSSYAAPSLLTKPESPAWDVSGTP